MYDDNDTPYYGSYWRVLANKGSQPEINQTPTPWRKLTSLYEREQQNPQESMVDTILREGEYLSSAGLNGLTQGYIDEIEGAVNGFGYGVANAAMRVGRNMGLDIREPQESFSDAFARGYQKARDYRRGVLAEAKQNSPLLSGTMEASGAIVSPLNKLFSVSKTAPLAQKAQANFNNAIASGVISGYGNSESNDWKEVGTNMIGNSLGNAIGNTLTNNLFGRGGSAMRRNVMTELTNRSLHSAVSPFLPPAQK